MSRQAPALAAAGAAVMDLLLADPEFVGYVAGESVERQVAAGTLIRTETMRAMPLEMVPSGTTAGLRALLAEARALMPKSVAGKTLAKRIDAALEGHDTPAPTPPPENAAPTSPLPGDPETIEGPTEEVEDGPPARRPRQMPEGPGVCSVCDADIDEEQRRLSWTRCRKELCKADQANWKGVAA